MHKWHKYDLWYNIMVIGNYRIVRNDKRNVKLQKWGRTVAKKDTPTRKKGEVFWEWKFQGFYSKLGSALEGLMNDAACDAAGESSTAEEVAGRLLEVLQNCLNTVHDAEVEAREDALL